MKPTLVLLSGSLVFSPALVAEETPVTTSMDIIATEQALPCAEELRELARSSLKKNPHRMLAYKSDSNDIHLFNALAVTNYRDRDSHVTFHGIKNANGTCDTSVTESYVLQTPCADARHEAFSKWDFQGKLTDRTMVLSSKRIAGKQAFLTDQFTTLCLVTTRQLVKN
ncbi:hypothetical protein [Vibrio penaeicida]|uniref:Uncharacterized protein n=1 Tax=Vibrio penaeicida TaxID=104609 RepID=A0AAV5NYK5_9VIBR|nr:hypothetical protein [Vibrio penaeicida]RTZ22965.1 hypothetical protein EKN09_11450 [Vibrio penaeicida]GLQ75389.1 hypothetical protein GCM10007932_47510 [Vibrio penaeicida]